MFPNLRTFHMSYNIDPKNREKTIPLLSFLPLKECRNLRNVDICLRTLTISPQHLIDLLHQNRTIKKVRLFVSFSPFTLYPKNEFSNDCVEFLELYTFQTTLSKSRGIITLDLVNFLLNSLTNLKHFGMVNQMMGNTQRISMNTQGSMAVFDLMSGLMDFDDKKNLITQEVVDYFTDSKQEFRFESFSFFFPSVVLKPGFFENNKWKNLKRLEFGCKNDGELINTIKELPIEHLQIGANIFPGHLGLISKMKKLRSFSGLKIDNEWKSFIRLSMKNLRVVCFNNDLDTVFYRCSDEYPRIIDPLERYDFGIDQQKEENKEQTKKEVVIPDDDDSEEEEIFTVFIGDWSDEMTEEEHESIFEDYLDCFDSIFLSKKEEGGLIHNISISEELYETFKNSLELKIKPKYYGYTIYVNIPSLVSSKTFSFKYVYHSRIRNSFNEKFETFTISSPQRKSKWKNPVGYQSLLDLRGSGFSSPAEGLQIFSKSMHDEFYCYDYGYADKHLLRTIEKAIFGKQVFIDLKYLLKFFYCIGGCDLIFEYGEENSTSPRKWILKVCEVAYDVTFKEEKEEEEEEETNIFKGQDFEGDPVEQKRRRDQERMGETGVCVLQ